MKQVNKQEERGANILGLSCVVRLQIFVLVLHSWPVYGFSNSRAMTSSRSSRAATIYLPNNPLGPAIPAQTSSTTTTWQRTTTPYQRTTARFQAFSSTSSDRNGVNDYVEDYNNISRIWALNNLLAAPKRLLQTSRGRLFGFSSVSILGKWRLWITNLMASARGKWSMYNSSSYRGCRRWWLSVVVAFCLCWWPVAWPASAAPTQLSPNEMSATSLRPGMTQSQAQAVERGEMTRDHVLQHFSSIHTDFETTAQIESPLLTNSPGEDVDDDDYDDYDERALAAEQAYSSKIPARRAGDGKKTLEAKQRETRIIRSDFATIKRPESASVTKLKVSLAVFVPTFGGTVVREFLRRKREAVYVKKGLEIQRAQYAEYFNVTSTNSTVANSDLEDALKGLKKNGNETDTAKGKSENSSKDGDDDDDDDDEDDDDEDDDSDEDDDDKPEPRSKSPKRPPRRPQGGGDQGGNSDGGDRGRPSDEDLNKWNEIFKKS